MGLTIIIVLLIVLYLVLFGYNARHIDLLDRRNKLLTAQLAQSERRIRATVEQANDPLITVDKHGSIKQWTPKAVTLFGLTEAEARSKSIFDFCNESTRAEAQSMFTKAAGDLTTIPHKPFEFTITASDGRETPVEISAFSISIDGEDMLCAFVRDITERKLIQERLNEFYYLVSHELRAPLTSIGGSIDLIETDADSTISKSSKKFLSIAQTSCQRLIKLVSDLLDVKKIELGKMNMAEEAVDLLDVVSDAVAQFESTFIQRQLKCEKMFDTTDFVTGDAERLVQVLTNLLANAIKFSPDQAMIVIKVDSPGQNRVRVSVVDQGPGIGEDVKSSLFQKFSQLQNADSMPRIGSGLGLAIASAIVKEHGGEIGVDSELGKGSTFWFALPARQQNYISPPKKGVA
jgi:PAS domain S-box-containing protein